MFDKMRLKPYLLTTFSVLIVLAGIIALGGILGLQNTKAEHRFTGQSDSGRKQHR